MVCEAYLFRIVGCRCRKWRLREGGAKQNQLFIIKCFRGWALVFASEAGSPALRRLNNREQRTDNSRQIGARTAFQKSSHFSKFSETVTAIFLLKSTNRRNYWDACHVKMGIQSKSSKCHFSIGSAAGQSDGPTGQGPRTVTFQTIFAYLEIFSNSNSSQ